MLIDFFLRHGLVPRDDPDHDALCAGTGKADEQSMIEALRQAGVAPSLFPLEKKLGRQLEGLQASGFTHYATLDGDGQPVIKEMKAPARS